MAKKPVKEAGTALIFATVFFVLTTIALGVLWYTEMNTSAEKDQAVENAKKDKVATDSLLAAAKREAMVHRVFWGIDDEDDRKQVSGWSDKDKQQAGETIKKINQLLEEKIGKGGALPEELRTWQVDEKGLPGGLPSDSPIKSLATLAADRAAAKEETAKAVALWQEAAGKQKAQEKNYTEIVNEFKKLVDALPKQYQTAIAAEIKKFDDRAKDFTRHEADLRTENSTLSNRIDDKDREILSLKRDIAAKEEQIRALQARLETTRGADTFINDQPHGKILRRLPDGIVEINIGSDALVRPGLTFTVLPQDFPEKGRQSRTFTVREPDERGVYKNVERFIERANIEVIEVLGPNLSRARITKEYDPIRDGATAGDLLYNSVWRKGAADRIALIGAFDVNGDGSDDIEAVIRDLTRMGIPVDAYYDMRERKWVGELTQHTRYVVEGWYPVQSGIDPNRDQKTKLIGDMTNAVEAAQKLGITPVKFQDFFPRIGYRMKLDTTKDKINQAIAPYLHKVAVPDVPPGGGN